MKKFLLKLSYTVFPVFLVLFLLVAYVTLYISPRTTGDLGKLAYIPFDCQGDGSHELDTLCFTEIERTEDLKTIQTDVLTVGDSFSQQGIIGYQNHLSSRGIKVINCNRSLYDNPIQFAYNILDQKFIDSVNCKVLIVQVGERDFVQRIEEFSKEKVDMYKVTPSLSTHKSSSKNSWSLLRARDFVMYRLHWSPVYVANLNKNFFESNEPDKLYFYCADISNGLSVSESAKPVIRKVYDLLKSKADERGISLLLMIPVDKYDLYQDYIIDSSFAHPKTVNEDLLSLFGNEPNVVLCKYLLVPLLEKGEKDVFLFDDSHWGDKASKTVAEVLSRRMKELMTNKSQQ